MALRPITSSLTNDEIGLDFTPASEGAQALESITDTFFTDLICEGPIAGFCDQNGDLIELNFINESSGLSEAEIQQHNKNEKLKLLKAFYANGTPLMDSLGKINFDQILFDFNLGEGGKVPGTSVGDPTFFRPNTIYNKRNLLIGPRPGGNPVGGQGIEFSVSSNFANAAVDAHAAGAVPIFHAISNPWIKNITIAFDVPQLFLASNDGSNKAIMVNISSLPSNIKKVNRTLELDEKKL